MSSYPFAREGSDADVMHGVVVPDPYRWLEDLESPHTVAWVREQNARADETLDEMPEVGEFRERVRALTGFARWDLPFRRGDRYFVMRQEGLRPQPSLCTMRSLDDEPRILVDPSERDRACAITGLAVNDDGTLLAYAISEGGSNWMTWRVLDVARGEHLPDVVERSKFSGAAWFEDGFFYSRYDHGGPMEASDRDHLVCYHKLGTPQANDEIVYRDAANPERTFLALVTEDGAFLLVFATKGHDGRAAIFAKDLRAPSEGFTTITDAFDARYSYAGIEDERLYFVTDLDAPRRRLVAVDVRAPHGVREVIGETDGILEWCTFKPGCIIAGYLEDVRTRVRRFARDGVPDGDVALPGHGWAIGFGGDRDDSEALFAFTGYLHPLGIHRYDTATRRSSTVFEPASPFDRARFVVEHDVVDRPDGARVPITLVRRVDVSPDGSLPTLLFGYGGFGIPVVPAFQPAALAWAERGGVYAIAHIRGGGELGEDWHRGGYRERKQTCFDDFTASAEWLCARGYTSPERLAITGGSNGGLLVGACITQRPELFGAAHASVGIFDMIRFPRFTIGWAWVAEYGSPDDPEDFPRLLGYSPLHNVRPDTRTPAVILTTGDHDDHVVPSHSYKFAAALQRAHPDGEPIVLRVYADVGHGVGKPVDAMITEHAESMGFLWHILTR